MYTYSYLDQYINLNNAKYYKQDENKTYMLVKSTQ